MWEEAKSTYSNGGYYADVELIRPDGTVQNTASLYSGSQTDIDTAPLATTGVYTLRIDPNSLGTGVYSMTVSTPATGTLSINGAAQPVTITRPAQDGWLTFNGVAGQVLTLTTMTPSGKATDLYVYTPSGAQLTSDYAYGTSNLRLPTLSSTGVYSVRIDPWSSYTGVYTLSLSAPVAQGGAKVLAKAEALAPAQQGGTAWQQLIAQLQAEGSTPANRVEVTKYYAFGGARVAMRQTGNEVFYLAGDHLGSASLVLDWQGRKISEMRYTPWGETRWAWELDGEGYTSRLYTSQLRQSSSYVGSLYDYGARFYNPTTGRFISPDILIDGETSSSGYNRYLYAQGNPIRYNDPSGHCAILCTALIGAGIGAAVEYGRQVLNNYQSNGGDFGKALTTNIDGWAIARGALVGGIAGATGFGIGSIIPGALSKAVVAGAVENTVAGVLVRNFRGEETTPQNILSDAGAGALTGGIAYGIGQAAKQVFRAMSSADLQNFSEGLDLQPKNPSGSWSLDDHLTKGSHMRGFHDDPYGHSKVG